MATRRVRRWALTSIPTLLLALAAGLVVLILLVVLPAASGSNTPKPAPVAAAGCVPTADGGGGLRHEAVPNGWAGAVQTAGQAAGIDPAILAAQLEAESSWNPNAIGPMTKYGTAKGMGQFIDSTWAAYGEGSVFDPLNAIAAQGAYMGQLVQDFTELAQATGADRIALALAAYNAGPGAVAKHGGIPPYYETQQYVPKILGLAQDKYSGTCQPATGAIPAGSGAWSSPLPGAILTSTYGWRWGVWHAGIDLATPGGPGTVLAVTGMVIETAGCSGDGYGCSVTGRDPATGYLMRYGHLATGSITVTVGQAVTAGTPLGTEGATGMVTGVHVHFEVYAPGAPTGAYHSSGMDIDPMPILIAKGVTV